MGKTKNCNRKSRRLNSNQHLFQKRCGCLLHSNQNNFCENVTLFRTSGKNFKKCHLKWLIDNKHISRKAFYVCESCLLIASQNNPETECPDHNVIDDIPHSNTGVSNSETITSNAVDYDILIETLSCALKENKLSVEQEKKLYSVIGSSLNVKIYEDSQKYLSKYKDLDSLCDLDCKEFLKEKPQGLLHFLLGATNIDLDTVGRKKLNALCILIEHLCFLRNLNFIGAFSFSQSLVKWTLSGSKTIQAIDGATTASGSVTSVKKVLKDSSSNPNLCFPLGDVDGFFDNTQRVGKTTRVRENGTTPSDVATNVVFIQNDSSVSVQEQPELKPCNWQNNIDQVQCNEKIHQYESFLNKTVFKPYSDLTQDGILNTVSSEIQFDVQSNEFRDHISYGSVLTELYKDKVICSKCCNVYLKSERKCPLCNYDPLIIVDKDLKYNDVPCSSPTVKTLIKLGEIIPVNPNSRENIKHVLKEIEHQADVGTCRHWIRVGCDGVPYRIADSIIKDVVVCSLCKKEVDQKFETFEKHVKLNHLGASAEEKQRFDSILLVPGAGHIELNLLRALFSFCKKPFLETLAGRLGFASKKAKDYIVNCGNHHLSWQIFQIIFKAFSSEIFYVYITVCKRNGWTCNREHFLQWKSEDVMNPNYHFYYDLIFKVFLGLKCFRSGIRQCNSKHMIARRQAVAPFMFIKKHSVYQPLLVRDMQIRVSAPEDVKAYIENNESFSRSGDCCKCEGGDYITENENRALKSHLPPGVPTIESWTIASRCNEELKKIRKSVFNRASIHDPGAEDTGSFNMDLETQMFRRIIRSSGILIGDSVKPLKAIDGSDLHHDLVNFYFTAQENYQTYLQNRDAQLAPVFVTFEDERVYNNINNWTVVKLIQESKKLLDHFSDQDLASIYRCQLEKATRSKKDSVIAMYNEILENVDVPVIESDTVVEEE